MIFEDIMQKQVRDVKAAHFPQILVQHKAINVIKVLTRSIMRPILMLRNEFSGK